MKPVKLATTPKKRLPALERRQIILQTAIKQFAIAGYAGSNLEQIARLSGVSKPILYDHFASKEALFLEVLKSIRSELLELGSDIVQVQGTTSERIRAAVLSFFGYVQKKPESMRVLLTLALGEPNLERLAFEIQEEVTTSLLELLINLQPMKLSKKQKRTMRFQVEFIKQGMHALALWWLNQPELELSKDQLTDTVMSVAWTGLERLFVAAQTNSD
jgi:AcrR family transcriptional regulator